MLLLILIISFLTEVISSTLRYNSLPTALPTTISVIIHHSCWLYLLYIQFKKKIILYLTIIFILFAIGYICYDGCYYFNYYTFVLGGLLYVSIFIFNSFMLLKQEKLSFILSNNYLLLFSPVIFFLGCSMMFGFNSQDITSYMIFGNIKLYDFIIYFVNIIYYSLINIYIYREKKLNRAK